MLLVDAIVVKRNSNKLINSLGYSYVFFHQNVFQIIPEKNRREISKYLFQGNYFFLFSYVLDALGYL